MFSLLRSILAFKSKPPQVVLVMTDLSNAWTLRVRTTQRGGSEGLHKEDQIIMNKVKWS